MLKVGQQVYHTTYGKGLIKNVEGDDISILFNAGIKEFKKNISYNRHFFEINKDGLVIYKNRLIKAYSKNVMVLPDQVLQIDPYAFSEENELLENVCLNKVRIIGMYAFKDCFNLKKVTFGNDIRTIEAGAFENCEKLASVELPNSLKSIESNSFDCDAEIIFNSKIDASVRRVILDNFPLANEKRKKETSPITTVFVDTHNSEPIIKSENGSINENKAVDVTPKPKRKLYRFIGALASITAVFCFLFRGNIINEYLMIRDGNIELGNGTYSGELSFGVLEGEGVFKFDDDAVFEGSFEGGRAIEGSYISNDEFPIYFEIIDGKPEDYSLSLMDGTRISGNLETINVVDIEYPNHDRYYGDVDLKSSLISGVGVYLWNDGKQYTGLWKNGLPNGTGELSAGEVSLKGNFEEGQLIRGTIETSDSVNDYSISVIDGKINNEININNNLLKYSGEYKNSRITGEGKVTFANGDVYEGQMKDGKMHGTGKYTWKDKKYYDGSWSEGKMNGYGVYYISGTVKVSGNFKDNKPNGSCYYYAPDGSRYVTYWSNGKMTNIYKG